MTGVRFLPGAGNFFSSSRVQDGFATHKTCYPKIGSLFPGVNRPGREADHSLPSSAEIKNDWSFTAILPHVFMCSIKQRIFLNGMVFG
jgi:hypothetical protein